MMRSRRLILRCGLRSRQRGFLGLGAAIDAIGGFLGGAGAASAVGPAADLAAGFMGPPAALAGLGGAASGGVASAVGSGLLGNLGSGLVSGLGSAVGPAIGGAITGGLNYAGQSSTNSANMAILQQEQAFTSQMSGSAYQRATADMAKAGLNPMLAYSQGGASTPSPGSAPPMQNALGGAVTAGINAASQIAQVEQTKAQTANIEAQTQGNQADAIFKQVEASRAINRMAGGQPGYDVMNMVDASSSLKSQADIDNLKAWYLKRSQLGDSLDLKNRENYLQSWVGRNDRYISPISNSVGALANALKIPTMFGR
jgi:hypothetical protein